MHSVSNGTVEGQPNPKHQKKQKHAKEEGDESGKGKEQGLPQDEEPMAKLKRLKKEGKSVAALELTDEMTTMEQRHQQGQRGITRSPRT